MQLFVLGLEPFILRLELIQAFQSASHAPDFVTNRRPGAQNWRDQLEQSALHLLLCRLGRQKDKDDKKREDAANGYGGALHESR